MEDDSFLNKTDSQEELDGKTTVSKDKSIPRFREAPHKGAVAEPDNELR